jgi:hypothetical protein
MELKLQPPAVTESVDLPPVAAAAAPAKINSGTLQRTSFRTSRLLDFCSREELIAQTGHQPEDWPLVVLKELVDNALDACEEAGTAPESAVRVDENGITVIDKPRPAGQGGRGRSRFQRPRQFPRAEYLDRGSRGCPGRC